MLYPALLKKKICSAFYCDILNTMLYYMYEGKPHTLQDLRMQYQLPCGMVSQIQTKGFDQRDWRLYAPSRVWNCCRKRVYCTWVRVRSNGPRSLFCFRPAEIIHYSDSKISKRYFRAETLRAFSRNKTKVVERTALESLILCRNNRFGVGRKYPTLYRASEQILLEGGKMCC